MFVTVPVLACAGAGSLPPTESTSGVPWLTRAYFVAYTAGQVLPTALGGDAVRVVETVRRHPGRSAVVTGTVVLERGLGGAVTVLLGAVGFVLSVGRYDIGAYLWIEGLFVFGTLVLGVPVLRPLRAPAVRIGSSPSSSGSASRPVAVVLRGHPPLPHPSGARVEAASG